jgi:MYXO-CTERM domain-containing protein
MLGTSNGWIAVGVALVAALWSGAARAEQIVVLDETWVHGPDMPDSHFRKAPIEGTPTDWTSPIDYSQGTAYVYLEVHSKPTEQPTKFQVCFEATPTYACTDQSPTYTTVGVYEWATPFANFWSPPGEFVDWSLGVNKLACILKDTMNGKPSADNVGAETAALYMPTDVRMVVTIVSPGGEYVPPTPSGEGSTGGEESGGSEDGSSTGAAGTTTGEVGTTTGEVGETGGASSGGEVVSSSGGEGGEVVTTGGGSQGGETSGGAGESTGAAPESDKDGGCACATGGGGGGWLGVLLGLGLLRRRGR